MLILAALLLYKIANLYRILSLIQEGVIELHQSTKHMLYIFIHFFYSTSCAKKNLYKKVQFCHEVIMARKFGRPL